MFLSTTLRFFLAGTLASCATSVRAEVKQGAPDSLLHACSHRVAASPATVCAAVGRIERWWSGDRAHSGDAIRLTLPLDRCVETGKATE
jgi:hypothetical protein